jgi:hypothetical protein
VDVVTLASEFPNDNRALHRGVIWVCLEPTGNAQAERVRPSERRSTPASELASHDEIASSGSREPCVRAPEASAAAHDSLAPPEDDQVDDVAGPIVVEELEPVEASVEGEVLGGDIESELALVTSEVVASVEAGAHALALPNVESELVVAEVAAPAPTRIEPARDLVDAERAIPAPAVSEVVLASARERSALDVSEPSCTAVVEVVTPVFEDVVASEHALHDSSTLLPAPDDPFTVFVCTLADVAIGAGSSHVASLLPGLLFDGRLTQPLDAGVADALRAAGIWNGTEVAPRFVSITSAWRAILRGTSDDFDACGTAMLDEWASELLARLLDTPAKAPSLRQELRSRGVAAFGLAA